MLTGKWAKFDLGKFLYRHIHYIHHKAYNPTALGGTNFHPFESFCYYSAAFICVPFGCHPCISLACIVDLMLYGWLGHDGFQWPGHGDYYHQLHHAHFDCNYGSPHVPMDKWFGTFISCKEELRSKVWKNKQISDQVGREAMLKLRPQHPPKDKTK